MNNIVLHIPAEYSTRQEIRTAVRETIAAQALHHPLTTKQILEESTSLLSRKDWDTVLHAYIGVHFSNEIWRDTITSTPPHHRLLLLPSEKNTSRCASIEELAGSQNITMINSDDEDAIAKAVITGKYKALIAVGEFEILYKGWNKIAGLGIPLAAFPLQDGKLEDISWVEELLGSEAQTQADVYDFNRARADVNTWFEKKHLSLIFDSTQSETEEIGIQWLEAAGKRWRPLLAYYMYTILSGDTTAPESIKKIALAVECFHKASLVHDDIEDDDDQRYGEDTMHVEYGIPIALNVGDYLIGEGYRMIARSGFDATKIQRMVCVASDGHRDLSLGQGEELLWMRHPSIIHREKVLTIFRLKTSPAFEVALCMGAIAGNASDKECRILKEFSTALGIAFQIRDDILDFFGDDAGADIVAMRPSVLLAMVREKCSPEIARIIDTAWMSKKLDVHNQQRIYKEAVALNIRHDATLLLQEYKQEAIRVLEKLQSTRVQDLLQYVISKIV